MRWVALMVVVVVSGCGRIAFDDRADASADAVPSGFCATATFSNPAASSLHEDFTTPYMTRWVPVGPPCIQQIGTELVASPSSMGQYCFAYTRGDVHLTCDSVYVRVPEVTRLNTLGVQTLVYVGDNNSSTTLDILLEDTGFTIGLEGTSPRPYVPFDMAMDIWWKVGELDGELIFETSADGSAWRERLRVPSPMSFDHVAISLGAGTYTVVSSPGQARFRCYNVPPPCN